MCLKVGWITASRVTGGGIIATAALVKADGEFARQFVEAFAVKEVLPLLIGGGFAEISLYQGIAGVISIPIEPGVASRLS